jgi:hypothetical protein
MRGPVGLGQVDELRSATLALCSKYKSHETFLHNPVTPESWEHRGHVVLEGSTCLGRQSGGAIMLEHIVH